MAEAKLLVKIEIDTRGEPLESVIRKHVALSLAAHGGDKTASSKALGISRATLYRYIKKFNLEPFGSN